MDTTAAAGEQAGPEQALPRRRLRRWMLFGLGILVGTWALLAYIILPALWRHYEHHPGMQTEPKRTCTKSGIPGDPLNVGLLGTEEEVVHAFLAAKWYPADPITFRTSLKMAARVLRDRPYLDAPVSSLYLWGRRQDLAFEQPRGSSPRQRHHVRFWKSDRTGGDGRPIWLGAATYDRSVGLSHRTAQVTHHIAPDIDAERDRVIDDLKTAGQLVKIYQVTGVGSTVLGFNGGGDWFYTDGELSVGVISAANVRQEKAPEVLANPTAVALKNHTWSLVHRALRGSPDAAEQSGREQ